VLKYTTNYRGHWSGFQSTVTLFLNCSNAEVKAKETKKKNISWFYILLTIVDIFFQQDKKLKIF